jgi:lambda family phage portal protein
MRANALDRAIAWVSPQAGARRVRARQAFEAFSGPGADGAPLSPNNGRWMASPRSANADVTRGLRRQRAESRELRASNPLAAGAIATNINRVVGTGLQPVAEPDAQVLGWSDQQVAAYKAQVSREFSLFADSKECTWDRQHTFYEWQQMVLGARLESGDCFTILPDGEPTATQPYRLRLQLLEADRCANPMGESDGETLCAGIRLTDGAPAACHILDAHPYGIGSTGLKNVTGRWYDFVGRSGRRRVLHHYRPTRPEQARGVPYLAPVVQAIRDLGRYTEAEITAAVTSAFFTVFIEQEGGPAPAQVFGQEAEAQDNQEIALGAGAVVGLAKGEKASFANPMRPNTAFDPFVFAICKLVGVGLNLPVEMLLKIFNSSYSASRAALLDAWQHFRTERAWLVLSACQPVYETLLAEAVIAGRIQAPGFFADPLLRWAYTRATWHGDSQGSLNPKDEVEAFALAVEQRFMTRERATWELFGTDWNRSYPAMRGEQQLLADDGMLPSPRPGAPTSDARRPTTGASTP